MNLIIDLLQSYGAVNDVPKRGMPLVFHCPIAIVDHPLFPSLIDREWRGAEKLLIKKATLFDPNDLSGGHPMSERFLALLWRCSNAALRTMAPALSAWARFGYFNKGELYESEPQTLERFNVCRLAIQYANRNLDSRLNRVVTVRLVETKKGLAKLHKDLKQWRSDIDNLRQTPLKQLYRVMRLSGKDLELTMQLPMPFEALESDYIDSKIFSSSVTLTQPLFEDLCRLCLSDKLSADHRNRLKNLTEVFWSVLSCSTLVDRVLENIKEPDSDPSTWTSHCIEVRGAKDELQAIAQIGRSKEGCLTLENLVSGWWNCDKRFRHKSPYTSGSGYALFEKMVETSFLRGSKGNIGQFVAVSSAREFYVKAGCVGGVMFIPESGVPVLLNNNAGRLHRKDVTDQKEGGVRRT